MFKHTLSFKMTRWGRIIWTVVFPALIFALLFINFTTNETLASFDELATNQDDFSLALQGTGTPTPTLQVEPTPTLPETPTPQVQVTPVSQGATAVVTPTLQSGATSTFDFSFASLGYGEKTLASPLDNTSYSFRMPEDWIIQSDGILDLDLSYVYSQVRAEGFPTIFGNLTVALEGQTLETFPIEAEKLDHQQFRIPLPASLLKPGENLNIAILFEASLLCNIPHEGLLTIHPTSSVSLNYNQGSITPDISRYPQPFQQRAFEPDAVRFVLPAQPASSDLTSAVDVATKLGSLTNNRIAISATTDLDLSSLLSPVSETIDEHLIVIGQPQDNQLLPLLNDATDLPVSLHRRQLELVTQGPTVIVPGETFTYVFTVTNTIDQALDLSLINSLPFQTELVDCLDCVENVDNNTITWNSNPLAPDETLNLSLTLRATDTLTSGLIFENTVTLVDEGDLGPLNADTLTSVIDADTDDDALQTSIADEEGYFFVYNEQAVAKGDGVIQEIVSPWSQKRAILIITGLNDEAVRKAAQAMSSETRFPGMTGPVALVQDVLLPSEINLADSPTVEFTFADLGYQEEIIRGETNQEVNYDFEVPSGWQLTEGAGIDLYFSHSQLIDYVNSGLNVLLNGVPAATIALSDETSSDGHIRLDLANAHVQSGENNQLTIQADMVVPGGVEGECGGGAGQNAWFLIKSNSKAFLAHNEIPTEFNLDLVNLPRPFQMNPTLTDLLFVLPDTPAVDEWEVALQIAASIGREATGKTMIPAAITSSDLSDQDLAMYHIIAIGRPSRNALIQQINDQLPQPFLPGTDEIEQRLDSVVLRLPPDIDLGYIQLISSPWGDERALLAVTGTTTEAVYWAAQPLVGRSSLEGNLALIQSDQIATIDTRELTSAGLAAAVATSVPELTPVITSTVIATPTLTLDPTPDTSTQQEEVSGGTSRPGWLIPLVGVNGLIVIGILGFAFWRSRQRRL